MTDKSEKSADQPIVELEDDQIDKAVGGQTAGDSGGLQAGWDAGWIKAPANGKVSNNPR